MNSLMIYLCVICALSFSFSVIALIKSPSSKLWVQLNEICKLLQEMINILRDFCNTVNAKIETTINSTVESPEFREKLRECIKNAIEEYEMMKDVRFEPIEDYPSIESIEPSVTEPDKPMAQGMAFDEIEDAVMKGGVVQEYGDRFFYDNYGPNKRSKGGNILVSDSNREFLRTVTSLSGVYNMTLSAYLDNIITDHIKRYGDEIMGVVNGKYNPDNLNNSENL